VFGNKALFDGGTVISGSQLWITDGTPAGTSELTTAAPIPFDITVLGSAAPAVVLTATSDFNNDGFSDLLWQNSSGEPDIWRLNGTSALVAGSIGNPGASWHVKAIGDFEGGGNLDLL
jgi:ELWxxDGT repeat protein